jgi:hypothetical protein
LPELSLSINEPLQKGLRMIFKNVLPRHPLEPNLGKEQIGSVFKALQPLRFGLSIGQIFGLFLTMLLTIYPKL